jgi:hypothetical protein
MVFLLEITNISKKSQNFWFADFFLKIFKIHKLIWISFVLNVFHQCFVEVNTNLKIFSKDHFQEHFCIIGWCLLRMLLLHSPSPLPPPKEIHWLGPIDLKIYGLERNPQLGLDS